MQSEDITQLLEKFRTGDPDAEARLLARVFPELRSIAKRHLRREKPNHTLQPTALVNEAYMRLVKRRDRELENRAHFFALAAQIMRQILIDHAREQKAQKRGGEAVHLHVEDLHAVTNVDSETLLAIDEALTHLSEFDPRQAQVVEMRFFGGLTEDEIATALGFTRKTIQRDWIAARAWLQSQLSRRDDSSAAGASGKT